jgi:hypothetical protein
VTDLANDASAPSLDGLKTATSYVTGRLDERIKQRDRLDTRTALLITTTGALITVIGIFAALLVKQGIRISTPLATTIAVAATVLVVPVLIVHISVLKSGNDFKQLKEKDREILEHFAACKTDSEAREVLQDARDADLEMIRFLDKQCDQRATWLWSATLAQLIGLVGLAIVIAMFAFEAE